MILRGILDFSLGGFLCIRGFAPLGDGFGPGLVGGRFLEGGIVQEESVGWGEAGEVFEVFLFLGVEGVERGSEFLLLHEGVAETAFGGGDLFPLGGAPFFQEEDGAFYAGIGDLESGLGEGDDGDDERRISSLKTSGSFLRPSA